MSTLSICILVRDEAVRLPACLAGLEGIADEVVVVDTGSTDDTVAVAQELGARTVRIRWPEDEGAARNAAAGACRGDYILFIDADERLAGGARRALVEAMAAGVDCGLVHVVEADSPSADPEAVVRGEQRLSEPGLAPRLLRRELADTWRGVAGAVPQIRLMDAPILDLWLVGIGAAFPREQGDLVAEAWLRRAVSGSDDAYVVATAARSLRGMGDTERASRLAERAWQIATAPQAPRRGLVAAATIRCLLLLDVDDGASALVTLERARDLGAGHPNLDLLEGLACIEVDTPAHLIQGGRALRRALSRAGAPMMERALDGATGDSARIALATVHLALGRPASAMELLDATEAASGRGLAARLARAEALLGLGRAPEALRLLVRLLEHAGPDGWTLAAIAARANGTLADAFDFVDRAMERAHAGFVAPHRRRLLEGVKARLTATAMVQRLSGGVDSLPEVVDPRAEGEAMAEAGELELAHALVIEALRRDPVDLVAWTDLGVIFHRAGAADAAAIALRTAIELHPDDVDLRLQLATALWSGGRLSDASAQARAALALAPETEDALALLQAMDVQGAPTACIAIAATGEIADSLCQLARLAGLRPVTVQDDIVSALCDGDAGRRAWLAAVRPSLFVVSPGHEAWLPCARESGARIIWLGPDAPGGVDVALGGTDDMEPLLPLLQQAQPLPTGEVTPMLSVVVPTRDRLDSLVTLLDRLALQTLPPGLMEVIVVDDGSVEPVVLDARRPLALTVVRREGHGAAAARNTGISRARAGLIWMLDDDARPAPEAAAAHVLAHARSEGPVAVMGGFRLLERHRRTVWDELLDSTPLHVGRPQLDRNGEVGWRSFGVGNTSVPRQVLEALGGFDGENFPQGIYEDAELGLRLTEAGVPLLWRPDIRCGHDHRMSLADWRLRARAAGRAQVALRDLHPHRPDVLRLGTPGEPMTPVLDALRSVIELGAAKVQEAEDALRRVSAIRLPADPAERARAVDRAMTLAQIVGDAEHQKGLLDALCATPPVTVDASLDTTSVVLVHEPSGLDADATLELIISGLRRTSAGPVELVVVHRGEPGPRLRAQPDIRRVAVPAHTGLPEAWNAGIAASAGRTVLLCDDQVVFTPGWRAGLLDHLRSWPDIGAVSALGARARGDLAEAAARFREERRGHHAWPATLSAPRCLVRREVFETIGGLDPLLGGLAGEDFFLRARLAGFRLRQAGDVLLGASDVTLAPSLAAREAMRDRWGLAPGVLSRKVLHQLVEDTAFDARRHVVPLASHRAAAPLLLGTVAPVVSVAQQHQLPGTQEVGHVEEQDLRSA